MSLPTNSETTPKARKPYKCEWCGTMIEKGETHYSYAGITDGDFHHFRMHLDCEAALRREMAEDDYEYCIPTWQRKRGMAIHEMDEGVEE